MGLKDFFNSFFKSTEESTSPTKKLTDAQDKIKGYVLIFSEKENLKRYFDGSHNQNMKKRFEFNPKDPACEVHVTIEELIERQKKISTSLTGLTSDSIYILRLGYDREIVYQAIKENTFHETIVDALNYLDLLENRRSGYPAPIPISNPNFNAHWKSKTINEPDMPTQKPQPFP